MTPPTARPRLWRSRLAVAAIAVVAGLLGGTLASAGTTSFTDVSTNHPFFAEIEAIRSAGITTGFPNGTYQPGQPVSRGAMAAFMGRGFGRAAVGLSTQNDIADATPTNGAQMTVASGATGAGGGFVVITASAQLTVGAVNCPCILELSILNTSNNVESTSRTSTSESQGFVSVSAQGRFAIPADETHTYRARYTLVTVGANTNLEVQTHIQGTYVPFNGLGNPPV